MEQLVGWAAPASAKRLLLLLLPSGFCSCQAAHFVQLCTLLLCCMVAGSSRVPAGCVCVGVAREEEGQRRAAGAGRTASSGS